MFGALESCNNLCRAIYILKILDFTWPVFGIRKISFEFQEFVGPVLEVGSFSNVSSKVGYFGKGNR